MNSSYIAPYSCVYVNSQYAVPGGTTSNFAVEVTGSQLVPRSDRTIRVAVTEATIPFTYYGIQNSNNTLSVVDVQPITNTNKNVLIHEYSDNITSSNNHINITETNSITGTLTFTATVPSGRYNLSALCTAIGTALTSASATGGYGYTYTVTPTGTTVAFTTDQTSVNDKSVINFASTNVTSLGFPTGGSSTGFYNGVPYNTTSTWKDVSYSATLTDGYYYLGNWAAQASSDLTSASASLGLIFQYTVTLNTSSYAMTIAINDTAAPVGTFPVSVITMGSPTTAQLPLGLTTGSLVLANKAIVNTPNPCGLYAAYSVTIAAGNYTPANFITDFEAALNAKSTASGFGVDFTPSSISTITGTIQFAVNNGTNAAGSYFDFGNSTIDSVIGTPQSGFSTIISNGTPYNTPFVYNLAGPRELHIRCNQLLNSVYETRVQTDGTILAVIPIRFEQDSLIIYEPALPKIYAVLGSRMDRMQFRLTDESGNDVSLNGAPMLFTLGIFQ